MGHSRPLTPLRRHSRRNFLRKRGPRQPREIIVGGVNLYGDSLLRTVFHVRISHLCRGLRTAVPDNNRGRFPVHSCVISNLSFGAEFLRQSRDRVQTNYNHTVREMTTRAIARVA